MSGNCNPNTTRVCADLSYFTCREPCGADATAEKLLVETALESLAWADQSGGFGASVERIEITAGRSALTVFQTSSRSTRS